MSDRMIDVVGVQPLHLEGELLHRLMRGHVGQLELRALQRRHQRLGAEMEGHAAELVEALVVRGRRDPAFADQKHLRCHAVLLQMDASKTRRGLVVISVSTRGCVHPVPRQARQEVARDEGIAVPAIARQHHLEEHVLRQEDPVQMPGIGQPQDGPGDLVVAGALHLLVGVEVIHADHVELDEGPAFGDARAGSRSRRARGSCGRGRCGEDRRPPPPRCRARGGQAGTSPGRCTISGRPVRACARAAPRRDCSSSAVKSEETPISPISPIRASVPSVPCQRLGHDLVGDIVDDEGRATSVGHRGVEVVARPHHDVQPGGRRDRRSFAGSRPIPRQVGSTTVRPPCAVKVAQLLDGERSARRSAMLCRLTKGSCRSSDRISIRTGLSARYWRDGSVGGFHQQEQSFCRCSCISVTPRSARRDRAVHRHHHDPTGRGPETARSWFSPFASEADVRR